MLIALLASTTLFAKIAGTNVLEFEGMGSPGKEPEVTLTLAADDYGENSATVNTPMGKEESESVEVDGNEFSFSTKVESPQGSVTMSYSGIVEDGELKRKVSAKALGMEMSFTGKLTDEESEEGSRRKGRRILPEDLQSAAQSTPGTKRTGTNRTDGGDER